MKSLLFVILVAIMLTTAHSQMYRPRNPSYYPPMMQMSPQGYVHRMLEESTPRSTTRIES